MTLDDVRAVLQAKPFRPFTIGVADGTQLEVQHPDNCLLAAASAVVVMWNPDRTQSQMSIIGLPLITRITFPHEAAK